MYHQAQLLASIFKYKPNFPIPSVRFTHHSQLAVLYKSRMALTGRPVITQKSLFSHHFLQRPYLDTCQQTEGGCYLFGWILHLLPLNPTIKASQGKPVCMMPRSYLVLSALFLGHSVIPLCMPHIPMSINSKSSYSPALCTTDTPCLNSDPPIVRDLGRPGRWHS